MVGPRPGSDRLTAQAGRMASPSPGGPGRMTGGAGVARIIAISNQKGGVGKTTTAISLAGALAELGFSVLCVDMDPQANLTAGLGVDASAVGRSIASVLEGTDQAFASVVLPTETPGIDLAPADLDLSATESQIISAIGREQILRDLLRPWVDDRYDFVLVDCPPTLGLLTINALVAADEVLIPVQAQFFSLKGFSGLNRVIGQIRKSLNRDLRILGLLVTFYDPRTLLGRDMLAEIRELGDHHVFETQIRQTVKLGEAPLTGRPITAHASTSEGARAYRALAREVIERGQA